MNAHQLAVSTAARDFASGRRRTAGDRVLVMTSRIEAEDYGLPGAAWRHIATVRRFAKSSRSHAVGAFRVDA